MEEVLELNSSEFEEDRYSRLRLIPWWEQDRLKNACIMVVGAGAIGNELIKTSRSLASVEFSSSTWTK